MALVGEFGKERMDPQEVTYGSVELKSPYVRRQREEMSTIAESL
jgi:hypothetical protein